MKPTAFRASEKASDSERRFTLSQLIVALLVSLSSLLLLMYAPITNESAQGWGSGVAALLLGWSWLLLMGNYSVNGPQDLGRRTLGLLVWAGITVSCLLLSITGLMPWLPLGEWVGTMLAFLGLWLLVTPSGDRPDIEMDLSLKPSRNLVSLVVAAAFAIPNYTLLVRGAYTDLIAELGATHGLFDPLAEDPLAQVGVAPGVSSPGSDGGSLDKQDLIRLAQKLGWLDSDLDNPREKIFGEESNTNVLDAAPLLKVLWSIQASSTDESREPQICPAQKKKIDLIRMSDVDLFLLMAECLSTSATSKTSGDQTPKRDLLRKLLLPAMAKRPRARSIHEEWNQNQAGENPKAKLAYDDQLLAATYLDRGNGWEKAIGALLDDADRGMTLHEAMQFSLPQLPDASRLTEAAIRGPYDYTIEYTSPCNDPGGQTAAGVSTAKVENKELRDLFRANTEQAHAVDSCIRSEEKGYQRLLVYAEFMKSLLDNALAASNVKDSLNRRGKIVGYEQAAMLVLVAYLLTLFGQRALMRKRLQAGFGAMHQQSDTRFLGDTEKDWWEQVLHAAFSAEERDRHKLQRKQKGKKGRALGDEGESGAKPSGEEQQGARGELDGTLRNWGNALMKWVNAGFSQGDGRSAIRSRSRSDSGGKEGAEGLASEGSCTDEPVARSDTKGQLGVKKVIRGNLGDFLEPERNRLYQSRWGIRWGARALPAIGFIGTVRGIMEGLGGADAIVRANTSAAQAVAVTDIAGILGIAFATTFVALFLGLVVSLIDDYQTKEEELYIDNLVDLIDEEKSSLQQ